MDGRPAPTALVDNVSVTAVMSSATDHRHLVTALLARPPIPCAQPFGLIGILAVDGRDVCVPGANELTEAAIGAGLPHYPPRPAKPEASAWR